jgi:indole-3-glycerol phosphate synthase
VSFLDTVIQQKREELAVKKSQRPASDFDVAIANDPVRNFRSAIERKGAIIAELKARTPSIPSFVQSERLPELATTYKNEGASAISIVTDEKNFGTSLDLVSTVRERVDLPVVVKEFVIDPYQILEARAHGADAILLIVRLLTLDQLIDLLDVVFQLGMSALVETHNEEEVRTAMKAHADIIGINNRDLDNMNISLDTTRRLSSLVPRDTVLVAESGIHTRADIEDLMQYGANAFLIGGSLLASETPAELLREFVGE